jgi:hypothetical protein
VEGFPEVEAAEAGAADGESSRVRANAAVEYTPQRPE